MAIKLRYEVTCICGGYFGGFTRGDQYRHSNCCSCAGEIDPIEGKRFRKSNSPEKLLKELGKDEEWLASMGMKLTQESIVNVISSQLHDSLPYGP